MERCVLKGIPASSGCSRGDIHIYEQTALKIDRDTIAEGMAESEIARLEYAISKTLLEVYDLKNDIKENFNGRENLIFEVYKVILEDRYFVQEIKDIITTQRYFAENAVDICMKNYIIVIEQANNELANQRIHDLNDIRTRVIKNITGENRSFINKVAENQIVAVEELNPSLAAVFGKKKVAGVVAEKGAGYMSHSGIILRGLGIPVLNCISFKSIMDFKKKQSIIDGDEGILVINPEQADLDDYNEKFIYNKNRKREIFEGICKPTTTKDGHRVGLHANISNMDDYNMAVKKGVDGIGLVRTEMLFINSKKTPGEREQSYIYSRIAKRMSEKPVIIRTLDIGEEKIPSVLGMPEGNNLQNLRGMSQSLENRQQLTTQIRSIMRASEFGNVSISFPMVNNAEEVKEVKKLIREIRKELVSEGKAPKVNMKTGVTIETNEAVKDIDNILSEVDFISLGTNDLFQQVMNPESERLNGAKCDYLDPRFLKVIKHCVDRANNQNKYISVCGEMASDPLASIILLGLGINDLSMSPTKSYEVNSVLRGISHEDTVKVAQKAIECNSAEEVNELLQEWMAGKRG